MERELLKVRVCSKENRLNINKATIARLLKKGLNSLTLLEMELLRNALLTLKQAYSDQREFAKLIKQSKKLSRVDKLLYKLRKTHDVKLD